MNSDDWVTCPNCWRDCLSSDLCEHDDEVRGPLCLQDCCEKAHPAGRKPWEVAA